MGKGGSVATTPSRDAMQKKSESGEGKEEKPKARVSCRERGRRAQERKGKGEGAEEEGGGASLYPTLNRPSFRREHVHGRAIPHGQHSTSGSAGQR